MSKGGHKPLILAFNDSAEVLSLFEDLLSPEGYQVSVAALAGRELATVVEAAPDLIILDYMWSSDDSGWSFLQMLKMDPRTKDIPIVLCTGAVRQVRDLEARLKEMGVRVVLKPFDIDELVAVVKDSLDETSGREDAASSEGTAAHD